MKSHVLHTVWCNISGEAAGEIWNWSALGLKGVIQFSKFTHPLGFVHMTFVCLSRNGVFHKASVFESANVQFFDHRITKHCNVISKDETWNLNSQSNGMVKLHFQTPHAFKNVCQNVGFWCRSRPSVCLNRTGGLSPFPGWTKTWINSKQEITIICPDCTQSLSFLLEIQRLERARCSTARETGASKLDGRARRMGKRKEYYHDYFFVLPPHSPRGCASLSLQSLNYCGREKKGTACSLLSAMMC